MDDKTAIEVLIQGAIIAYGKGVFNDNIRDGAYIISAINHFKPELFAEAKGEEAPSAEPAQDKGAEE